MHQRASVRCDYRRLSRRIYLRQHQRIHAAQHFHEILEQVTGSRITMRLKGQDQSVPGKCTARRGKCGEHFGRVMSIIVDQRETAAFRQGNFSVTLKTSSDALKFRERRDNRIIRDSDFQSDRNCGKRVQNVVHTRQIQRDIQIPGLRVLSALCGEAHLASLMTHVHGTDLRVLAETVCRHWLADARNNFAYVRIINA